MFIMIHKLILIKETLNKHHKYQVNNGILNPVIVIFLKFGLLWIATIVARYYLFCLPWWIFSINWTARVFVQETANTDLKTYQEIFKQIFINPLKFVNIPHCVTCILLIIRIVLTVRNMVLDFSSWIYS